MGVPTYLVCSNYLGDDDDEGRWTDGWSASDWLWKYWLHAVLCGLIAERGLRQLALFEGNR
jgi:hypothetical protein